MAAGRTRHRRLGAETPRLWTKPHRELTPETSLGFAAIEFAVDVCGVNLYPWQRWLLIHALELDPALTVATMHTRHRLDPLFRFRKIVVLVARQNGKSTLAEVLALFFMYSLGTGLVLGTAQDVDTAKEVWQGAVDIAQESPELAPLIKGQPRTTNGQIEFNLVTGERYKVKAANRRAGRGLSGDLILLDEIREHQSWDAWGAITKTTNARPAAQIWALSNAGDATSIVLRYLRKQAHLALGDPDGINADESPTSLLPDAETIAEFVDLDEDDDELEPEDFEDDDPDTLGLFEWSAPSGCPVTDRDGWAQANPSMGYGISERTIAGDAKSDPEWTFRTEVLCQWSNSALEGPFPPGQWDRGQDVASEIAPDSRLSWCVDVSTDRTWAHIAVAGLRADGLPHVEVVARRAGVDWVVDWFDDEDRVAEYETFDVVVQERGAPASPLIEDLDELEHVTVIRWGGADLGNATAKLFDLVKASAVVEAPDGTVVREGLCHLPQPPLDVAAGNAVPKILTDGGMAWDRKKSPVDISPLVAVTGALWYAQQRPVTPGPSVYETNDLMVV
jgi:hypothetical protein